MANYNGSVAAWKFNSQTITGNVLGTATASRDAVIEDVTPFGTTDAAYAYAGLKKGKPVVIEGLYDDTAVSGTDALFVGIGTSATLELDIGGSKKFTVTAFVQTYDRIFAVGKMTRYKATLQPSGAFTET